jgi:hypothetical protein
MAHTRGKKSFILVTTLGSLLLGVGALGQSPAAPPTSSTGNLLERK